jgi:hypothetical protein
VYPYQVFSALAISVAFTSSVLAADLPSKMASEAPAPHPQHVSGFDAFVSLGAGYTWGTLGSNYYYSQNPKANGPLVQGRASFAVPVMARYGLQIDAQLERAQYGASQYFIGYGSFVKNTADIAGHLYWRNSNRGLFGVLAQGTITETNLGIFSDRRYFLGVEGQYFLGNLTLYGQVAYQNFSFGFPVYYSGNGIEGGGFNLVGQARYFWKPNTMFVAKAAYEQVATTNLERLCNCGSYAEIKHSAWMVGGRVEHRLGNSPFSMFVDAEYRVGTFNWFGYKENEKDTRLIVGVKYNFGTKTLFERDRSGASLDPIRPLRAIFPIPFGPT